MPCRAPQRERDRHRHGGRRQAVGRGLSLHPLARPVIPARLYRHGGAPLPWLRAIQSLLVVVRKVSLCHPRRYYLRGHVIHACLIVVASRVGGVVGYFHRPQKNRQYSPITHISECFLLARLRRRINGPFFRPKRRKQAFIGRQNKRPSSAVMLPDAVTR